MNKSPHIVGGGLGTFRRVARAEFVAANKSKGPATMAAIYAASKRKDENK